MDVDVTALQDGVLSRERAGARQGLAGGFHDPAAERVRAGFAGHGRRRDQAIRSGHRRSEYKSGRRDAGTQILVHQQGAELVILDAQQRIETRGEVELVGGAGAQFDAIARATVIRE